MKGSGYAPPVSGRAQSHVILPVTPHVLSICYMPKRLSRSEAHQRHTALADHLRNNVPVGEALVKAGYTETQAHKGWDAVPQAVTHMLLASGVKLERIGKALKEDKEKLENRIIGAMHERMVEGHKDGVPAAKILTTHKSVASSFIQEQQNNVVIIQAPSDWKPETLEKPEPKQLTKLPALPEYE